MYMQRPDLRQLALHGMQGPHQLPAQGLQGQMPGYASNVPTGSPPTVTQAPVNESQGQIPVATQPAPNFAAQSPLVAQNSLPVMQAPLKQLPPSNASRLNPANLIMARQGLLRTRI